MICTRWRRTAAAFRAVILGADVGDAFGDDGMAVVAWAARRRPVLVEGIRVGAPRRGCDPRQPPRAWGESSAGESRPGRAWRGRSSCRDPPALDHHAVHELGIDARGRRVRPARQPPIGRPRRARRAPRRDEPETRGERRVVVAVVAAPPERGGGGSGEVAQRETCRTTFGDNSEKRRRRRRRRRARRKDPRRHRWNTTTPPTRARTSPPSVPRAARREVARVDTPVIGRCDVSLEYSARRFDTSINCEARVRPTPHPNILVPRSAVKVHTAPARGALEMPAVVESATFPQQLAMNNPAGASAPLPGRPRTRSRRRWTPPSWLSLAPTPRRPTPPQAPRPVGWGATPSCTPRPPPAPRTTSVSLGQEQGLSLVARATRRRGVPRSGTAARRPPGPCDAYQYFGSIEYQWISSCPRLPIQSFPRDGSTDTGRCPSARRLWRASETRAPSPWTPGIPAGPDHVPTPSPPRKSESEIEAPA